MKLYYLKSFQRLTQINGLAQIEGIEFHLPRLKRANHREPIRRPRFCLFQHAMESPGDSKRTLLRKIGNLFVIGYTNFPTTVALLL